MGGPASEALRGDGAKRKSVRKSCRSAGDPARKTMRQHREDAANWGTAAEHLRTRVLAFAAAALTFAASGSCPIEQPSATTTKFVRRNWISPKMVYLCLRLESRKDVQERRHINPFGKR